MASFLTYKFKESISKWLEVSKIQEPNEIQQKALPVILSKNNTIIVSQTGSGKTLCYLLPIINSIDTSFQGTQALIILPTKELARQVYSYLVSYNFYEPKLRTKLAIGGENTKELFNKIKANQPHIIVGTIFMISELLEQKYINREIKTVVFDEADMLFDMGFIYQVDKLLKYIDSKLLQKIAASATLHETFRNKLAKFFTNTKIITSQSSIWDNKNINQTIVYNNDYDSLKTLKAVLNIINPYSCLIFANTRNEIEQIKKLLEETNKNFSVIHKDLSPRERKNIFNNINSNKYQYILASDLASRGLDIKNIDLVISYGLPEDDVWYMHRIGRVGRNFKKGEAMIIYKKGIDSIISRLNKKGIKFNYQLIKGNTFINKDLRLHLKKKILFDDNTNKKIKEFYNKNSKVVKPGYKKKIKEYIHKISQKKKHEFIDKKIKENLVKKWKENSKSKKEEKLNHKK